MPHIELWMMLVMSGVASLVTGLVVGLLVSQPLRTYQLMLVTFLGALSTWLTTALFTGWLLFFALEWVIAQILPLSVVLILGLLATFISIGGRSPRRQIAQQWSMLGSFSAWLLVAIASLLAYHHFKTSWQPSDRESVLPTGFWACISYSMALSSIFGACSGGLVFHQTRHLRSKSKV
ncbi:MAG: hypothetical protein B0A82_11640 [Alkalinema sp. CACIAM 70d]|nr:MAG: hypothetical protein B0A82_11640 [Alkalinema sp. CACIAM 70d]